MKTSELVKRIEQFKLKYRFEDDSIVIVDECDRDWICIDFISESYIGFSTFEDAYIPSKYFDFLNVIIEYCNTSLEERKEVKKYRLKLNELFVVNNGRYVNFNTINKNYDFNNEFELHSVKTIFTQKEIDAMPFDTNFFIKEEVK